MIWFLPHTILFCVLMYNYTYSLVYPVNDKFIHPRAYYISHDGNDKLEGTRNAPFQSIERINNLQLMPGDSLLFEAGHQFTGTLYLHLVSADSVHPTLISSYGKGDAVIYSGHESAIVIRQSKFIKIKKLKLVGSGRKRGNTRDGLSILNSSHILAENLEISGFQKSGLYIDASGYISVQNIFSHANGFAGISVGGSSISKKTNEHIYMAHCRVENNPGDPSNLGNHSGNGIVVSYCTGVLIEYCTATNNGWDMPRKGNGPVGIWAFEADSVTIQHCLSYRNKTSAGGEDGGGFDFDGGVTHSIVQYCLSYENQGAGYCIFQYSGASPWHDNVFRFNISENDGMVSTAHAGIYIWNGSSDSNQFYNNRFYNNTIYNSSSAAIHYAERESARRGFYFYNNIFTGRDSLITGKTGSDIFIGNDWWRWAGSAGRKLKPKNGLYMDPAFKKTGKTELTSASGLKHFDRYKIPPHSTLRNKGVNLWRQYKIDPGNIDFNEGKVPLNGIGACF